MSLFLMRMTMFSNTNHVCSKDITGSPTPLLTQVLRHFSLDAKLGLTDVQVNEVYGIITSSYTFNANVTWEAVCLPSMPFVPMPS